MRVVGRIEAGVVSIEPGEDPLGKYHLVTTAFVLKFIELAYKIEKLELEVERLKQMLEKEAP